MRLLRISIVGLLLSLLVWSPLAYSQITYSVPLEADQWKRQYLNQARQVWGLDLPAWLAAQVGQESGWRDGLRSSAGAQGLCQFIEATAVGIERQYAGLASWGRYSPRWCFYAQNLLMRELFHDYRDIRDGCNAIKFAGSAYNGGPTMLGREVALCVVDKTCDREHWDENVAVKNARAGWAWRENREYVTRITQREAAYAATGWGRVYCRR